MFDSLDEEIMNIQMHVDYLEKQIDKLEAELDKKNSYLKKIQADNEEYIIKLESALNNSNHWQEQLDGLVKNTACDISLLHAVVGLSSEVGELADAFKKHYIYETVNWNDTKASSTEEAADILYYLQVFCIATGTELKDLADILQIKLQKRYPTGWSKEACVKRADKNE